MPSTTEEYRKVMRVEMFSLLSMAAPYKAKNWLHGLEASHFNKFVDYIMGDRVLGIQIPSSAGHGVQQKVKPDWSIVLSFEHKLRKEAMRLITHEGHSMATALQAVAKDADLKEAFFTTPVALRAATPSEVPPNKWPRFNTKGNFSGKSSFQASKGRGGKSGKGKTKDSRLAGLELAWRTHADEIYVSPTTQATVTEPSVAAFTNAGSKDVIQITLQFSTRRRRGLPIDGLGVRNRPAVPHALPQHHPP